MLNKNISLFLLGIIFLVGLMSFTSANFYQANYLQNNITNVSIAGTVINTSTVGTYPHSIWLCGGYMWTANFNGQSISRLNFNGTVTTVSTTGIDAGWKGRDGACDASTNKSYVVGSSGTKNIVIYPNLTMLSYNAPATAQNGDGITFDGTSFYVFAQGTAGNSVYKLWTNGSTGAVHAGIAETVNTGTYCDGALWTGDGNLAHTYKINTSTWAETNYTGAGKAITDMKCDPDKKTVLISAALSNVTSVQWTTNGTIFNLTAGWYPYGVAYDQTHKIIATSNRNSKTMTLYYTANYTTLKTISGLGSGHRTAWDGGTLPLTPLSSLTPTITPNSPANTYNSSSKTITFNASVSSWTTLSNVSLFIDNLVNQTNVSGFNASYIFTTKLSEGSHTWLYNACNTVGCINSSARTVTIDTTTPTVNITYPYPNGMYVGYQKKNTNLTINWTAIDLHLSTCLLQYKGTNHTETCSTNTTGANVTSANFNNATLYANDSTGNWGTSYRTWKYRAFENSLTYTASVSSGSASVFTLNTTLDSALTLATSYLVYNGTSYLATSSVSGPYTTLTLTKNAPQVSTQANLTFYWNLTFSDGVSVQSSSYNQTVNPFFIGNCSGSFTNQIYNFTLYDEETQSKLPNASVDALMKIYSTDRSISVANYSISSTTNPTRLCTNSTILSGTNYSVDVQVKYASNSSYDTEYYNIIDYLLTNTSASQNIALYPLLLADETDFQVTLTDTSFIPVENAIIYVQRQYISDNNFKTVEAPKTDSNGQTIVHLVRNDITYNLVAQNSTNGTIITTLSNILAYCADPTTSACVINMNAFSSGTQPADYNSNTGLGSSGPSYNTSNRKVTYGFTTTDSTSKNVTLVVRKFDQFGNATACYNSLTAASGTLVCTVPQSVGNSTLQIDIYSQGVLVFTNFINQNLGFGIEGWFFLFMLMIMLALMTAGDKNVTLIAMAFGLIIAGGVALINSNPFTVGSAVGFALIAVIILLWKLNQNKG